MFFEPRQDDVFRIIYLALGRVSLRVPSSSCDFSFFAEPSTRRSRLRDSGRRIVSRSLSSFEEPNHAQYFVTNSFLQVESPSAIALVLILGWASFEDSTVDFVFDSLRRLQSRVLFRYLSTIPKSNHFSPSCDDSKVEFLFVITFL